MLLASNFVSVCSLDLEISTVSTNNVSTFSIKIGRSFLLKKYGFSGEQPFVIKYKGQRYYIYMIKLTSAYFKSRPDTTRAQLNRRACFDEIKKSPDPFIFLGYDGENDVLVCWNNKIAKARLNEKNTVSCCKKQVFQCIRINLAHICILLNNELPFMPKCLSFIVRTADRSQSKCILERDFGIFSAAIEGISWKS